MEAPKGGERPFDTESFNLWAGTAALCAQAHS